MPHIQTTHRTRMNKKFLFPTITFIKNNNYDKLTRLGDGVGGITGAGLEEKT